MARVLICGVATVDFVFYVDSFPDRAEKYRARDVAIVGGGCAANAAVAVARLGGEAVLAGRLGDDRIGDMVEADLQAEGVDTALLRRFDGARSAYSSVYVDPTGERQIMNFRGDGLPDDADWLAEAGKVDAVLSDTRWGTGALAAMAHARGQGVPGVMDGEAPIHAPSVAAASHVAYSMQGLQAHSGMAGPEGLSRVADTGWSCVTDGANGVHARAADGTTTHHPAFPVTAVDTLGAGDVWHGAFALALAEGSGESEAIRFASAVAALKCTHPGGRSGIPTRAETDTFLRETGQ